MSIKRILILGLAATALSTVAWADDTYQCGESRCYDDQMDETRRLNLIQLENPGAGLDAVPGQSDVDASYDDADDSPYADDGDDGDDYGPPSAAPALDDSYAPEDAKPPYGPSDEGAYLDDYNVDGYPSDGDDVCPCPDDDE